MSVFQRGGNFLHQRLTKLYSDTKQSYEKAAITAISSPPSAYADPDIESLRREFQIQQDRLLAWGLDWADTNAAHSKNQRGDVEIDKKLDKAGVGDVVAKVMSEIQRLLDEARNMQRPTKKSRTESESKKPPTFDIDQANRPWTWHEITDFRSLLSKLTACLDDLYKLTESTRTSRQSFKFDRTTPSPKPDSIAGGDLKSPLANFYRNVVPSAESHRSSFETAREIGDPPLPDVPGESEDVRNTINGPVSGHSHEIDYASIHQTHNDDPRDSGLPLYEEAMAHERSRVIGTLIDAQRGSIPVIAEFVSMTHDLEWGDKAAENVEHAWHLFASRLSASHLSHNGHTQLLGYTFDRQEARFGIVYQLPGLLDTRTANPKSLSSLLSVRVENSDSSPSLEDRVRLAYNLIISQLGLMLEGGLCHGNLDSTNIVLFQRQHTNWLHIREPYLFSHAKLFPVSEHFRDLLSTSIYRHPNDTSGNSNVRLAAFEIYSLGLILLEIGLWHPLSKFWKPKYDNAMFMKRIKQLYVPKLASRCGTAYMQVVTKCLNAPEELGPCAANEMKGADYMLSLARDMSRCCAIDFDGASTSPDLRYFEERIAEERRLAGTADESMVNAPMTPQSLSDEPDNSESKLESAAAPSTSTVHRATALRKWTNIDIPQADLDEWNMRLMPRISKLLQNALKGSPDSCSASLVMVGESPDKAKTTICVQCGDVERVRQALQTGFRARKGWGVVILKGDIRRSGRKKNANTMSKSCASQVTQKPLEKRRKSYQEKPSCGASIGAFKDNEHLPPVSFGGTILVDGRPFGMTVHHMLDNPSEDESDGEEAAERCSGPRGGATDYLQYIHSDQSIPEQLDELDISDDEADDSDSSTIRPDYAAFDEEGNEFWFLDDAPHAAPELVESDFENEYSSSDEEDEEADADADADTRSVGDITGVDPCDEEELLVTQPAIDDVEDGFFPCAEDRDDDHLDSHSLGYIHASSGIRRLALNGVKHEIDWALIKIKADRLQVGNSIKQEISAKRKKSVTKGVKRKQSSTQSENAATGAGHRKLANPSEQTPELEKPLYLSGVAPLDQLGGSEVYCCGRTSGFQKGRISKALTLVKMHGRESFSSSWCVEGGFGVPGDSGAWIYNPNTLQLCGHVLAWGNNSKTAYIAPMQVLFEDIRRTLGAEQVSLPNATSLAQVDEDSGNATEGPWERLAPLGEKGCASLNQQLDASKEVELALKEMRLGSDVKARPRKVLKKDVPNSFQITAGQIGAKHGSVRRSETNSGTVR